MQINSVNGFNFSAKIDKRFKVAAKKYFEEEAQRQHLTSSEAQKYIDRNTDYFDKKVEEFQYYGTPDMEIRYRSNYIDPNDGKKKHILFAHEEGEDDVIIAGKERFRALLERFYNINRKNYPEEEIIHIVKCKRCDGDIMV